MGGYSALSADVVGEAADLVREAAACDIEGRANEAVLLYERAFSEGLERGSELPSFLVGRLAVLYRRLCRYDDEIFLLERYRDVHPDDDLQTRYRARLTKAYALAEQHRMSDSVALASVRASTARSATTRRRPRRDGSRSKKHNPVSPPASSLLQS